MLHPDLVPPGAERGAARARSESLRAVLYLHSSAGRYGADRQLALIARGLDPERYRPLVVLAAARPARRRPARRRHRRARPPAGGPAAGAACRRAGCARVARRRGRHDARRPRRGSARTRDVALSTPTPRSTLGGAPAAARHRACPTSGTCARSTPPLERLVPGYRGCCARRRAAVRVGRRRRTRSGAARAVRVLHDGLPPGASTRRAAARGRPCGARPPRRRLRGGDARAHLGLEGPGRPRRARSPSPPLAGRGAIGLVAGDAWPRRGAPRGASCARSASSSASATGCASSASATTSRRCSAPPTSWSCPPPSPTRCPTPRSRLLRRAAASSPPTTAACRRSCATARPACSCRPATRRRWPTRWAPSPRTRAASAPGLGRGRRRARRASAPSAARGRAGALRRAAGAARRPAGPERARGGRRAARAQRAPRRPQPMNSRPWRERRSSPDQATANAPSTATALSTTQPASDRARERKRAPRLIASAASTPPIRPPMWPPIEMPGTMKLKPRLNRIRIPIPVSRRSMPRRAQLDHGRAHQAEDRAGGADRDRVGREQQRAERARQQRREVDGGEADVPERRLEHRARGLEQVHVEGDVEEARVQEAAGDQAPVLVVDRDRRAEQGAVLDERRRRRWPSRARRRSPSRRRRRRRRSRSARR